jgi:dTDP-4-amino-4,6-dideoxygalactose transaminase
MPVKIPLFKVFMPPENELIVRLKDVLYSGTVTEGEQVALFEEMFGKMFDTVRKPLTTNSCTSALQLAYRCANVKNKIVLTTPMTCVATNMAILAEGGKIVWCDVDEETGNISVKDVEKKIQNFGDKVAAISFVDFAGYPADIASLIELKRKYGITLIEDSAQSLGAKFWIQDENFSFSSLHNLGAIKQVDYTCFSFQAIKHLTTCDGGALICSEQKDYDLAKKLKWFGVNRELPTKTSRWDSDVLDWGYKFHMNNVNAAIGVCQLKYVEDIIKKHCENGNYFDQALKNVNGVSLVKRHKDSVPSYWCYVLKVERRQDFIKLLTESGIGVSVIYRGNNEYSCFKDNENVINSQEDLPGLIDFSDKYVIIPCGWWVSDEDRDLIVNTIKKGW